MGETEKTVKDSPQTTGQTSSGEKGSTSQGTTTTKTKTEEEYQKAISDERAIAGREKKALEKQLSDSKKESETLKSQVAKKDNQINEVEGKITKIEAELEDMASDDPDKKKYLNKIKELEEYERTLKDDRTKLDSEVESLKPEIESGKEIKRTNVMGEVASEFKGADMDRLRAICDRAKISTSDVEAIRGIAESIWEKADSSTETKDGQKKAPPHADSGDTKGGSDKLGDLPPAERVNRADKLLRAK